MAAPMWAAEMEKQMAEEEKQEAEIQQELAKSEDVTAYVEERQEQEADDQRSNEVSGKAIQARARCAT